MKGKGRRAVRPVSASVLGNPRGVSLIELMTATLIFSLTATFGMKFLILQHRQVTEQEDVLEAQQEDRVAMDFMRRELGILGFGLPEGEAGILKASGQEIEFRANLDHQITHLIQEATVGQTWLTVNGDEFESGDEFLAGKTVLICGSDRCEWNRLARDGLSDRLELGTGLSGSFPIGSKVQVINTVRYSLKPDESSFVKLIRTVDGGSNAVAEKLTAMELDYLDHDGRVAAASGEIDRVRVRVTSESSGIHRRARSLASEVHLRNR